MARLIIGMGAILGFLGVALGAFGAHGLKDRLSAADLGRWETGAHYQMVHAVAVVLVGILASVRPATVLYASGWSLVAGTLIFSGSLYLLALTGLRWWGAVTPIGGVAFLVGWALLAFGALKG